jgi:2'-5' RNA ligase
MRLFIAIDVPKEIKKKIEKISEEFIDLGKINFVKLENQHLTLKFLGGVDESKVEFIKQRLGQIKFKKFNAKIDGLGVFPNENFIRVLWVGIKAGEIYELQQKIDAYLKEMFTKDDRFHAHLTIGRVKFIEDKDKFRGKLKLEIKDEFYVENFKLIKSVLTPDGPVYEVLGEFHSD